MEAPAHFEELVKKIDKFLGDRGLTDLDEKGVDELKQIMSSYQVILFSCY